jgi:hypothetical protein
MESGGVGTVDGRGGVGGMFHQDDLEGHGVERIDDEPVGDEVVVEDAEADGDEGADEDWFSGEQPQRSGWDRHRSASPQPSVAYAGTAATSAKRTPTIVHPSARRSFRGCELDLGPRLTSVTLRAERARSVSELRLTVSLTDP